MTRTAADGTAAWPPPALDPAGPFAEPLNTLSWVLFAMAGSVLLIVVVALAIALFGLALAPLFGSGGMVGVIAFFIIGFSLMGCTYGPRWRGARTVSGCTCPNRGGRCSR